MSKGLEPEDFERLNASNRFTGYAYALTDVVNAITDYLDEAGTIVLTAHEVVDITDKLMERANANGDFSLPAR